MFYNSLVFQCLLLLLYIHNYWAACGKDQSKNEWHRLCSKKTSSGAITLPVPPKMGHLFKLLMAGSWVILTLNLD